MHSRGQNKSQMKIQGVTTSVRFLEIQQLGACPPISTALEQIIICHLPQLGRKHDVWQAFWILEAACSVFRNTALIYFLHDKEHLQQGRVMQQIEVEVQASLTHGQCSQWAPHGHYGTRVVCGEKRCHVEESRLVDANLCHLHQRSIQKRDHPVLMGPSRDYTAMNQRI